MAETRAAHDAKLGELRGLVAARRQAGPADAKVNQIEALERELAELEAARPPPEDAKTCSCAIA